MRRSGERCPARLIGSHTNPSMAGVLGGPSAARKGRCQGAERRGSTDRTEGRGENPAWIMGARALKSGSEERPGTDKTPRWSAGWRGGPIARAAGSPSHGEHVEGAPSGAPLPLSYGESEERDRRCAPASVERGGGALAVYPSPLWGGWTRAVASGRVGRDHA